MRINIIVGVAFAVAPSESRESQTKKVRKLKKMSIALFVFSQCFHSKIEGVTNDFEETICNYLIDMFHMQVGMIKK